MMFLELHRSEDNKKVLFNVNNINTIYEDTTDVYIYVGEIAYRVKESYSEIINVLNRCLVEEVKADDES